MHEFEIFFKLQQNFTKHREIYEKTIEKYDKYDNSEEVDWSDLEDEDGEEVENQIDLAASFNEEIFSNVDFNYAEKIVSEFCSNVKKSLTSTPIHNEIITTSTPITNEPVANKQSNAKNYGNIYMPQITPIKGIIFSDSSNKKPNESNRVAPKRNILDLVRQKNMIDNIKKIQPKNPNEKENNEKDEVIVLSGDDDDDDDDDNTYSKIDSRFNFQNLIFKQLSESRERENKTVIINDSESTIPFVNNSIMTSTRCVPNTQPEVNDLSTSNSRVYIPETQMLTKVIPDTQPQQDLSCQIADLTNPHLEMSKDNKRSNKDRSKSNDSDLSDDTNSKKFKYCETLIVDDSNLNTQRRDMVVGIQTLPNTKNASVNLNDTNISLKSVDISILNSTPNKIKTSKHQITSKLCRFESFMNEQSSQINSTQNPIEKNAILSLNNSINDRNLLKNDSNLIHNGQNKSKLFRNFENQNVANTNFDQIKLTSIQSDNNKKIEPNNHLKPKQRQDLVQSIAKQMPIVVKTSKNTLESVYKSSEQNYENKVQTTKPQQVNKTLKLPENITKSAHFEKTPKKSRTNNADFHEDSIVEIDQTKRETTAKKTNSLNQPKPNELAFIHELHQNGVDNIERSCKTNENSNCKYINNKNYVDQLNKSNSTKIQETNNHDLFDDETICEQINEKNKSRSNQTKKVSKVSFVNNFLYDDAKQVKATSTIKKILNSTTNQSNINHFKLVEMVDKEFSKKETVNESNKERNANKANQLQQSFKFTSFVDNDFSARNEKRSSDSDILIDEDIILNPNDGPLSSTTTVKAPITLNINKSISNKKEIIVIKRNKSRKSESDCLMPPPPTPALNVSPIDIKQKRDSSTNTPKGIFYCGKFIPVVDKQNSSLDDKAQITIKLNNSSVNKSTEVSNCSSGNQNTLSSTRKSEKFNLQKFLSESFKKSQEKN